MKQCKVALKSVDVFRCAWNTFEHSKYKDSHSWFDLLYAHSMQSIQDIEQRYDIWNEHGDSKVKKCYKREIADNTFVYIFSKNGHEVSFKQNSILLEL